VRVIDDRTWAVLTVYGEARGQSARGKQAVANVIRNRMARRYASDGTVVGTVLRAAQFSCWTPGDPNLLVLARVDAEEFTYRACERAWDAAATEDLTGGAVAYLNVALTLRLRAAAGKGATLPAWAADPRDPGRVNAALVTLVEDDHHFLRI